MYLLHPIYFTDVGWPPNFISNLRGARRAGGREWKFSQSPGTAGGVGGGTRAALGEEGRGLHGVPHPAALGGAGGLRPACAAPSTENAGTLEIPALPTLPPCFNYYFYYYHYYFPYFFYYYYHWIFLMRNQCGSNFPLPPPPSCLVTRTPPGLSPHPPPRRWAVTCYVPSISRPGARGGRGRLRGRGEALGGRGFPGAAMLPQPCPLRDGQPGSSRRLCHHPRRGGWVGAGGVSRCVTARARVPRPGEGAARRGRGGSGRGAGPGALLQPGFLCSECPLNMRCHRLPLPLPAVPALHYFFFLLLFF